MSNTTMIDPAERAQLEHERDFLLRSLDDLEREREKGAIDDESYARLHGDYTARAAGVLRTLEESVDPQLKAPPSSRRRRALTALGVTAFVVVVALVLAAALTDRLPGQTSSGNTGPEALDAQADGGNAISVRKRIRTLRDLVAANPDNVANRLLLARFLEADDDPAGALEQYDAVLALDPASAEAEAQSGRILYLTAQAAVKTRPDDVEGLVQRSRARLDHAVALDPEHADARFFRAIVLANEFGEFTAAQSDLQRYLILAPEGPFADQARRLLADVTSTLDGTPLTQPSR